MINYFKRLFSSEPPEGSGAWFALQIEKRKVDLAFQRTEAIKSKCSNFLSFKQTDADEECYGKFVFNRDDVEEKIKQRLLENSSLMDDDEGQIYQWIKGYDSTNFDVTEIPKVWSRFIYLADDLIRNDNSYVVCLACNQKLNISTLVSKDDQGRPSWNFNRILCKSNHLLLKVKTVHINFR
jgi:hypothetical protein